MSGRAVRVLLVAPSLDTIGGQSVQAARLLEGLAAEPGVEVSFLPTDVPLRGPLRPLRSVRYARTLARLPLYASALAARVRRHDVVHVFAASFWSFLLAPTPAVLLASAYGRRSVLHYHSGHLREHLARWPRATRTLRRADAVVVPSRFLRDELARHGVESVTIPNVVDHAGLRFRARTPLRPSFLSTRALEAPYDVATVIRAFSLIQQRVPEALLRVVGEGGERERLQALVRTLGVRSVRFDGWVPPARMAEVYDSTDVLLNASTVDNMPLSILEAFACGLPVVSSDAGGIPDIVASESTGLLVPAGDAGALASAALRLLADPPLAARLAEGARAASERYSWSATRDEWLALYERLAPSRG